MRRGRPPALRSYAVKFEKSTVFDASVEEVFAFHERPDAFALLMPPWEKAEIVQPPTSLETGTTVILRQRVGLLWITIEAVHVAYEKNARFVDEMRRGPFAKWRHEHRFEAVGDRCRLTDAVEYAPPLGPLGRLVDPLAIRPRLRKMFDYRHEVTRRELEATTRRPSSSTRRGRDDGP